jgi:hypothetical protein
MLFVSRALLPPLVPRGVVSLQTGRGSEWSLLTAAARCHIHRYDTISIFYTGAAAVLATAVLANTKPEIPPLPGLSFA